MRGRAWRWPSTRMVRGRNASKLKSVFHLFTLEMINYPRVGRTPSTGRRSRKRYWNRDWLANRPTLIYRLLVSLSCSQPLRRKSSGSLQSTSDDSDTDTSPPLPPVSRRGRRKAICDSKVSLRPAKVIRIYIWLRSWRVARVLWMFKGRQPSVGAAADKGQTDDNMPILLLRCACICLLFPFVCMFVSVPLYVCMCVFQHKKQLFTYSLYIFIILFLTS